MIPLELGDRLNQSARRRITTLIAVAAGDATEPGLTRARERLTVLAPQGAATAELLALLERLAALVTPRCPRCLDPSIGMCGGCRPEHAREIAAAYRTQAGLLPLPPAAAAVGTEPALPAVPPAPAKELGVLDRLSREEVIAMCASKRRHVSMIDADKAARRHEEARPGTVLRSYACPCCHGWHLTHTKASETSR